MCLLNQSISSLLKFLVLISLFQLESSFIAENNDFGKMPPKGADLFSEIHGDMHGRIAELEAKNDQLALSLKDAERDISFVVPVLKKLEVMSTPGELICFILI